MIVLYLSHLENRGLGTEIYKQQEVPNSEGRFPLMESFLHVIEIIVEDHDIAAAAHLSDNILL
jgi:hypothetical protein